MDSGQVVNGVVVAAHGRGRRERRSDSLADGVTLASQWTMGTGDTRNKRAVSGWDRPAKLLSARMRKRCARVCSAVAVVRGACRCVRRGARSPRAGGTQVMYWPRLCDGDLERVIAVEHVDEALSKQGSGCTAKRWPVACDARDGNCPAAGPVPNPCQTRRPRRSSPPRVVRRSAPRRDDAHLSVRRPDSRQAPENQPVNSSIENRVDTHKTIQ